MELVGELSANVSEVEMNAAYAKIESAIKAGFSTNLFACKLPVGNHAGKCTGLKWFRTWQKSETLKGTILTIEVIFDVKGTKVTERITVPDLAAFKSYGKTSDITVSVAPNNKGENVAKVQKNAVVLNPAKPATTAKAKK